MQQLLLCRSNTFAQDNITEARKEYKTFPLEGYEGKKVLIFFFFFFFF